MKVVITDAAYVDLLRIGREIRKDAPVRAEIFVAEGAKIVIAGRRSPS